MHTRRSRWISLAPADAISSSLVHRGGSQPMMMWSLLFDFLTHDEIWRSAQGTETATAAAAEWDDVNFYWIMKNHLYETMETQRFFLHRIFKLTHSFELLPLLLSCSFNVFYTHRFAVLVESTDCVWMGGGKKQPQRREKKENSTKNSTQFALVRPFDRITHPRYIFYYFLCSVWFFHSVFGVKFSFSFSVFFLFPFFLLHGLSSWVSVVCHTCHVAGNVRTFKVFVKCVTNHPEKSEERKFEVKSFSWVLPGEVRLLDKCRMIQ